MHKEQYQIIKPNKPLERRILSLFTKDHDILPLSEIVKQLDQMYEDKNELRPSDTKIRETIWRLIDHNQLHILDDRRLQIQHNGNGNGNSTANGDNQHK